jgi:hypothetical protein
MSEPRFTIRRIWRSAIWKPKLASAIALLGGSVFIWYMICMMDWFLTACCLLFTFTWGAFKTIEETH